MLYLWRLYGGFMTKAPYDIYLSINNINKHMEAKAKFEQNLKEIEFFDYHILVIISDIII